MKTLYFILSYGVASVEKDRSYFVFSPCAIYDVSYDII